MTIVNVPFDVPPEMAEGLAKGLLKTGGWVIRNANESRIVRHLPQAGPAVAEGAQALAVPAASGAVAIGKRIWSAVAHHKKLVVVVVAGTAAGLVATGAYKVVSNRRKEKEAAEESMALQEFDRRLSAYISALSEGDLDIEVVDALRRSIDDLEHLHRGGSFRIEVSGEQMAGLVEAVIEYTERLAEANVPEKLPFVASSVSNADLSSLEKLRQCLDVQSQILREAA